MAQESSSKDEALDALVASFKALNKYDSELNTGEVMNWLDDHYDAERSRLNTILAGYIPLKDSDGNKFVLCAYWTLNPDNDAKIGKRMAIYDEHMTANLSQEDVDALFDGVDMWVKLRICETESQLFAKSIDKT